MTTCGELNNIAISAIENRGINLINQARSSRSCCATPFLLQVGAHQSRPKMGRLRADAVVYEAGWVYLETQVEVSGDLRMIFG